MSGFTSTFYSKYEITQGIERLCHRRTHVRILFQTLRDPRKWKLSTGDVLYNIMEIFCTSWATSLYSINIFLIPSHIRHQTSMSVFELNRYKHNHQPCTNQIHPRSTNSFKLPDTLFLISLMSGWSSGVSSPSRISLHAAVYFDNSFVGLGSFVGLSVMKQKLPRRNTVNI